jgi:hypothetical protein
VRNGQTGSLRLPDHSSWRAVPTTRRLRRSMVHARFPNANGCHDINRAAKRRSANNWFQRSAFGAPPLNLVVGSNGLEEETVSSVPNVSSSSGGGGGSSYATLPSYTFTYTCGSGTQRLQSRQRLTRINRPTSSLPKHLAAIISMTLMMLMQECVRIAVYTVSF